MLPFFTKYLRFLREKKKMLTQRKVVSALISQNIKASHGTLNKYEQGQVEDPCPEVLRGLATIYEVDYEKMIAFLAAEKYSLLSTDELEQLHLKEEIDELEKDINKRKAKLKEK